MEVVEENLDVKFLINYQFKVLQEGLQVFHVDCPVVGQICDVDGEEGLAACVFHGFFEEGQVLHLFPDGFVEVANVETSHWNEHQLVEHFVKISLDFTPETGMQLMHHQTLVFLVELHIYFVLLLQFLHLRCQGLLDKPKQWLVLFPGQLFGPQAKDGHVKPGDLPHDLYDLPVLHLRRKKVACLFAPVHAEPSSNAVFLELISEFFGLADFDDDALVVGVVDTELVFHLWQLVLGQHVQLATFLHEDAQLAPIREYLVPVLNLHPVELLSEHVREYSATDLFLTQFHDVLFRVVVRSLLEGLEPFGGLAGVFLFSLCLHSPLVLELKSLVFRFECHLQLEATYLSLVENAHQLLGLLLISDGILYTEIVPGLTDTGFHGGLDHFTSNNIGFANKSQYMGQTVNKGDNYWIVMI